MKKNSLTFDARRVYCFLPESYWRKQLLINLGIGLMMILIRWMF